MEWSTQVGSGMSKYCYQNEQELLLARIQQRVLACRGICSWQKIWFSYWAQSSWLVSYTRWCLSLRPQHARGRAESPCQPMKQPPGQLNGRHRKFFWAQITSPLQLRQLSSTPDQSHSLTVPSPIHALSNIVVATVLRCIQDQAIYTFAETVAYLLHKHRLGSC